MANEFDIDWELVILKTPIPSYLKNCDLANLCTTTIKLRSKYLPILFANLKFNRKVLNRQSNYFGNMENFGFENLTTWQSFKLFGKYMLDKNKTFKSAQIDKFIDESIESLSKAGKYCNSLVFDSLDTASYFLSPLMLQFVNLKKLDITFCYIPLLQFNDILLKLSKLEVLNLFGVHFVRSPQDNKFRKNIHFSLSLKELTFGGNNLITTELPQSDTVEFVSSSASGYDEIELDYDLLPQSLPKLVSLNYGKKDYSPKLASFLDANFQLKDLMLPITQVTIESIPILATMPNLENLSVTTRENHYSVPDEISTLPNLSTLRVLSLELETPSDFKLASQFIKLTPNLTRLSLNTSSNSRFSNFDELVNNLKYFSHTSGNPDTSSYISKTYYK